MAITRRQFVGHTAAATILGTMRGKSEAEDDQGRVAYRLFWGDLHNHNAIGYGKGSLERSIDLARAHLDFFAFTGHASWHDMPKMPAIATWYGSRGLKLIKSTGPRRGN